MHYYFFIKNNDRLEAPRWTKKSMLQYSRCQTFWDILQKFNCNDIGTSSLDQQNWRRYILFRYGFQILRYLTSQERNIELMIL